MEYRCILCCRRNGSSESFHNISTTIVQTSKKSVKSVLTHLSKCIKGEYIFEDGCYVCNSCFENLAEYDHIMLQLLTQQKKLSRMLEDSMKMSEPFHDVQDDQVPYKVEIKEECSIDNEDEDMELNDNEGDDMECNENEDDSSQDDSKNISDKRSKRFQCNVCDKRFNVESTLQTHIESHSKAVTCTICGIVRRDEEYLELHMNTHEGKTENECRYCPKRYSRRANVIRHMHLHWDKKKFQCEKCGLRFSQANLLYNHRMIHEAEEQPLVCELCEQSFKSKKTYRHHMVTHQEDRPMYPCDICGKKFTEKYTLKMHLKAHNASKEQEKNESTLKKKSKEFSCIICEKVLTSKESFDAHMTGEHDVIGSIDSTIFFDI